MNPFFQQTIIKTLRKYYKKHPEALQRGKSLRQNVHEFKVEAEHGLLEAFYLLLGVLSAAFGLKGFLIPSSFIDGGIMGVSLIVNELSQASLPVLIILFNAPFIALAWVAISKRFAVKSVIGIILLSIVLVIVPFPEITQDKILVSAFGGLFLGLGIGLAIRGGAIIDGTEVLAIYISRKSSLSVGNVILIFNVLIFLSAAWLLSVEVALYAILTYFAASKTVDFVIDGIEEFTSVFIVSDKSHEVKEAIIYSMGRGCTVFKGQKGITPSMKGEVDIIYTVITRLEVARLTTEIDKIDPEAFVIMSSVKDARGGMIKKKPIKKIK